MTVASYLNICLTDYQADRPWISRSVLRIPNTNIVPA